jgi:hypothetical protein
MSPRRAARAAVVYTLIFGVTWASAQPVRRPVAVIELSDTAPNQELAKAINAELNNSADLKPLDAALATELYGAMLDEEGQSLDSARRQKQTAEDQVGAYNFPAAAKAAQDAIERLWKTPPTPQVLGLYAELAFILGVARFGERKFDKAADAFRLAHALAAGFKPDAIRYVPEVVQAYETAIKAKPPALGKIDVAGTGRTVIDGREVGTAPAWFDAPAGTHVVWLVDTERHPRAKQVVVIAGQKERIEIEDAKVSLETKLQRARLALKLAPDPAARASAMQQLATLLEVKDAVLLTAPNGKTVVQVWTEKAPGFSALRERKDEKPIELLGPLLPPKKVVIPPPKKEEKPKPIVDMRSWYEKPRYQIGGGTALVVALGVLIYALSTWDRFMGTNPNAGFDMKARR